jgi:hypothetical protein
MKNILTKEVYRTEIRKLQNRRAKQIKARVAELMDGIEHGKKDGVYYKVADEFGLSYAMVRGIAMATYYLHRS